uniref:Uncharacterized protein n=1 Tax=viral metagenome TaxID=1070528 RepID=A0A6C0KYW7_9ZZZZ
MSSFLKALVFIVSVTRAGSTITSDTGCSCVVIKTAITAPGAATTVAAGCSTRLDWLGQQSQWCLTDQTLAQCGTMQPGFGYVDSCQSATIAIFNVAPPTQLEWDQTPTTYYTGQLVNTSWTTTNIQTDEQFKVTFLGRTVTTTVNNSAGFFQWCLSDATSSVTTVPSPIQITSITNPAITANSTAISVIQSKVQNVNVYNNGTLVNTGTVTIMGQNVSVTWRGLGEAQIGLATVVIKSSFGGGGGTTVGTQLVNITATGNTTAFYNLPMTFTPNGFTTYSAQITINGPSNPYTASSPGFKLAAGPSPSTTPSATPTQTPSQTASLSFGASPSSTPTPSKTSSPTPTPSLTPSLSTGATASNTPTISVTSSITPSQTPTISISSSPSVSSTTSPSLSSTTTPNQTPAPSVDILAITRAAAEAESKKIGAIAGGAVGGLVFIGLFGFMAYKAYERKQQRERRLRKHRATIQANERAGVYGVHDPERREPQTVVYQVQHMPRQNNRQQLAGYQSRNLNRR